MPGPLSAVQISLNDQTVFSCKNGWPPKTPSGLAKRAHALLLLEQGSALLPRPGRSVYRAQSAQMARRFRDQAWQACMSTQYLVEHMSFPRRLALHIVKLARCSP